MCRCVGAGGCSRLAFLRWDKNPSMSALFLRLADSMRTSSCSHASTSTRFTLSTRRLSCEWCCELSAVKCPLEELDPKRGGSIDLWRKNPRELGGDFGKRVGCAVSGRGGTVNRFWFSWVSSVRVSSLLGQSRGPAEVCGRLETLDMLLFPPG